jgi:(p)ppGpp synthase/HD superfamily hydrolase
MENIHEIQQILDTIIFMGQKHSGQIRRFFNEPYMMHPIRVAKKIMTIYEDIEIIQTALLHDILEDTNVTRKTIKKQYGEFVLYLVSQLTSNKDLIKRFGKKQYLATKMTTMDEVALYIKLVDRLDNIQSCAKVKNFSEESLSFVKWYKKETEYILNYLERHRTIVSPCFEIAQDIRKTIKKL